MFARFDRRWSGGILREVFCIGSSEIKLMEVQKILAKRNASKL